MVRKKRFLRNRYLGVGTFTATLLFAGMHQKFVLEPMDAATQAQHAAALVTGNLQKQMILNPENKKQEVSLGIEALLQRKLQALLADSQTSPPLPLPLYPITHTYHHEPVPQ